VHQHSAINECKSKNMPTHQKQKIISSLAMLKKRTNMKLDVKCGHIVDKRDMANYKNACSLHDIG
jgi:hypothetical protein